MVSRHGGNASPNGAPIEWGFGRRRSSVFGCTHLLYEPMCLFSLASCRRAPCDFSYPIHFASKR